MNDQSSKPVFNVRDNAVQGTTFRNEHDKGVNYNHVFNRSYKDNEGNWQKTNNFQGTQLLQLREVVTKCYEQEQKMRAQDRENSRSQEPQQSKENDRER